jgi:outer membrane translocation and assembly module TamA
MCLEKNSRRLLSM